MFLTFERECNCVDFKICFLALSLVGGFFHFFFFPRLRALKSCKEALKFLLRSFHFVPPSVRILPHFQVHADTNQNEPLPGQMFAVESEPEEPGLQPPQRGETTRPRTGSCQPLIAEPLFDRQPLK